MSTVLTPQATVDLRPSAARRGGYIVAIAVNGALLWVAHQLLGWGWPGFLTEEFDRILGLLSASFVASMVVNAGFLVRDRGRFRGAADLVTSALGFAVLVQTWRVFPFDFAGYSASWTWIVRTVLVIGIVGTAIGVVVGLVTMLRPRGRLAR